MGVTIPVKDKHTFGFYSGVVQMSSGFGVCLLVWGRDDVKMLPVHLELCKGGICSGHMGMSGALKTEAWLRCLRMLL